MKKDPSLSRFHKLVDKEPLFAAEGLDVEHARSSLERLREILSKLEEEMSKKNFALRLFFTRYPLWRYAVPVTFLRSFFDAEEARRSFIAHPSREVALRLLSAWEKAQHALLGDIRRYRFLLNVAYRMERQRIGTFYFPFGEPLSPEDADTGTQLIEKNAHVLRREIDEYEKVLSGAAASKEEKPSTQLLPIFIGRKLLPWQERLHALVEKHTIPFRGARIIERHGPFAYTLSFIDGKPTEHLFFIYILESRASKERFLQVAVADEFYFRPIDPTKYSTYDTDLEPLFRAKIPYWYHPAAQFYLTRDSAYWADLATMVDIKRRPHLRADLLEAQRSSLFDLILSACVEDVHWLCDHTAVRVHKMGKPTPNPFLYLLLSRTYPSIFYVPFNSSVWRLDERPYAFPADGVLALEKRLYRPSSEVLSHFSEEALQTIFSAGKLRRETWLKEGITGVRSDAEF